jgi:hypothetical protein
MLKIVGYLEVRSWTFSNCHRGFSQITFDFSELTGKRVSHIKFDFCWGSYISVFNLLQWHWHFKALRHPSQKWYEQDYEHVGHRSRQIRKAVFPKSAFQSSLFLVLLKNVSQQNYDLFLKFKYCPRRRKIPPIKSAINCENELFQNLRIFTWPDVEFGARTIPVVLRILVIWPLKQRHHVHIYKYILVIFCIDALLTRNCRSSSSAYLIARGSEGGGNSLNKKKVEWMFPIKFPLLPLPSAHWAITVQ